MYTQFVIETIYRMFFSLLGNINVFSKHQKQFTSNRAARRSGITNRNFMRTRVSRKRILTRKTRYFIHTIAEKRKKYNANNFSRSLEASYCDLCVNSLTTNSSSNIRRHIHLSIFEKRWFYRFPWSRIFVEPCLWLNFSTINIRFFSFKSITSLSCIKIFLLEQIRLKYKNE